MNYILIVSGLDFDALDLALWQYGSWSFQTGDTKLERFLPKNQDTQRKLLSFENCVNLDFGGVKMCQNLTFKVNFLFQKLSESFSFFIEEYPI